MNCSNQDENEANPRVLVIAPFKSHHSMFLFNIAGNPIYI